VSGVRIDIGAYERQAIAGLPPLVVDTAADENDADYSAGDLSLREAVGLANGNIGVADTIEFAPGLTGAIALVLGQLKIVDSVTLTGPGADILAIDAQGRSRVLNIDDGDDATQLTAHIVDLTFTGGRALGTNIPYLSGGGIRSRENLFLTDSVISNNISSGGLYLRLFSGAAATITGSTIANNFAFNNGRGGGIHVRFEPGATMTIANSTISGNRATKNGGGIYAVGAGDITIAHTTITGNTSEPILGNPSESVGGGISNLSGTLTLNHAIIADNIDSSGVAPDINGTVAAAYSLIGDNTGATITDNGGNQIGDPNVGGVINPLLGLLADNGGPTLTHALMTGSPALDMGDVATSPGVSGVPLFDQRGNNYGRVQNGRIDIGAFEVRETVSADFDIDNDIDGFDFLLWQRGFGTPAPNAAKSDGDADNDLDAEGGDLGVRESQFGQPAPAVAASSSSAISYSSTSESVNEESPLTSVSVVGLTSLSSAPQQAAASIDATPVSVAEKSLVTLATPTSVQLASAAQAISGFSTIILRAGVFKSHLNTVRGNLFEVNGLPKANDFAEFVDLAFEQAWDDLDSSAHEYGNLVRKIANYVEGGYRKSHARVVDGVFATLAEEEEFVGLRPLL
jgi:parallel beta-helix repeat protein